MDENGNELSLQTTQDHPFEIIIPRDPTIIISQMNLQNVTSIINSSSHYFLFNLHFVNISGMLSISVHFEFHPLNMNLSYLLIYKFDRSPILNSSFQQIDGWTLFCPSSTNNSFLL